MCEVKYEHIVSLLSVLIFVFTLNNFKEFVEDIECGRQRIIFATTVIFITKSTTLDIFFLRFQYSFFSMFSYTRATVWLKKNGCIEYGEEREREYDWYPNRKGLCKVDATLAWFSKTTLNLFSICYRVMKPLTSVYLHFLSLRKKFFK